MIVEFRLSMPSRNTWNGAWSGDEHNYTLVREVDAADAVKLDGRSWSYGWRDGWRANIDARIVPIGPRPVKSDGFCGYDWMVTSILRYGKIYADHERPEEVSP